MEIKLIQGSLGQCKETQIDEEIKTIGVAGGGTMGIQLSIFLLSRSFEVVLFSRNPAIAKQSLDKFLKERYRKMDSEINLGHITITSDMRLLSKSQIVLECIKEDLNLKRNFLRNIIEMNESLIVGSCTSSLTLKELTKGIQDGGRIQIIHFSNPVAKMKVIEVVISDKASKEIIKNIQEFLSQLPHKAIEVPDIPGFVINSIIFAMIVKANLLVSEYGVTKQSVDDLIKIGCGLPMGPFEIEELIGEETVKLILQNLDPSLTRETKD